MTIARRIWNKYCEQMQFGKAGYWIAVIFAVYVMVSVIAYRFRHPEMTETQLLVNVRDALLWSDL
jgi:hypothetical protein